MVIKYHAIDHQSRYLPVAQPTCDKMIAIFCLYEPTSMTNHRAWPVIFISHFDSDITTAG
jgi:hypothetical protein